MLHKSKSEKNTFHEILLSENKLFFHLLINYRVMRFYQGNQKLSNMCYIRH